MAPAARWANVATAPFTGDAAEFEPGRSTGDAITAVAVDPFSSSENAIWREPNLRGRLLGLDPGKLYEISFVAQYAGSSNDLSARYTVVGATSGSAVLNAAKNSTRVARIPFIAPTAAGMIEFTIPYDRLSWALKAAYLPGEDDSLGENEVAQVFQKGYILKDRVVRHAVVQVAN